jgi:diguanylate cyclase (GGDEF)-like protein
MTKTLFNSKVSQRIAILLFIAALVPTMLMTLLSNQKINNLITHYEHKLLLEKSRSYGLATFSNMLFARATLNNLVTHSSHKKQLLEIRIAETRHTVFHSIYEVSLDGDILNTFGFNKKEFSLAILQKLREIKPNSTQLLVQAGHNEPPKISLIFHSAQNAPLTSLFIAEIDPDFLWGSNDEYPTDIDICVYQINNNAKVKLFCSQEKATENNALKTTTLNNASWELFLAGEFNTSPWVFEINRTIPITENRLKEFVGSKAYISIAILSFLLVVLLSLIQIRKTMVPLEHLIDGTKKIAAGDYGPVQVSGTSEFSELAGAFNSMSSHIKQQLDTLQSFSALDKEIIENINIEHIIKLALLRMQELEPHHLFYIAYIEEKDGNEVQCNCFVSGHSALTATRLSISNHEINIIKRYNQGHVTQITLDSERVHERLMAELGANYIWVLPIFWQGEIVAVLAVGSKTKLDPQHHHKREFNELASRVAIVIAAQEREQQLLFKAQYDSLTGLPNRILLQDRLKVALEQADRINNPVWILFIDLDRFKVVNDSMGHAVGDALLTEIGQRLQNEVRETDTVARFGGDEFIVVLAGNVGESIKLNILNRLMRSITLPIHINNQVLINTCSIGISVYPNDGENAETLIKNADVAMYRAKELGRNNYQFFMQCLNSKANERMQMITLLRQALEHNEFTLHYQPKVDLTTKHIVGLEALIRWNNATLGNVSPAEFIPIAEEAGLIIAIGEWVLRSACKQLAIWRKLGATQLVMSVNISTRQFNQVNLVDTIKTILIETGIKAEHLELELTESLLMNDSPQIMKTLYAIKALGIQLSIDDFGTGYSSLSYLNTLPIDTLKIDKAFVDAISLQSKEAPIVNTIIYLADSLGLKVVAEGVETSDQVHYLKAKGCDQIQGYYFSKPLPADGISQMLLTKKKLDLPKSKDQ